MKAAKSERSLVGRNIRYFRKKRELSIEKLAEIADISPKYLGSVERGENNISIDNVIKIAKALDVSLYKLFIIPEKSIKELAKIIDMLEQSNPRRLQLFKNIISDIITTYETKK